MTADHIPERLSPEEREALRIAWRGPWGDALVPEAPARLVEAVERILAAHLADVEARLAAAEAEHRVIHQAGAELVCFCGAHLSVYGLTWSLASAFAQHVRSSRALTPDPSARA